LEVKRTGGISISPIIKTSYYMTAICFIIYHNLQHNTLYKITNNKILNNALMKNNLINIHKDLKSP